MSILSKLGDLAAANFGDLTTRLEDPEKMVALVVSRMTIALGNARASATRTLAERAEITRLIDQLQRANADWQAKAQLALDKGRNDLARAALVESEKGAPEIALLQVEVAKLDQALAQVESDISRLTTQLAEARTRQVTLQARSDMADSRVGVRMALDDPTATLLNDGLTGLERHVDWAEAAAASFGYGKKPSLDDDMRDLELAARVDARFAALLAQRAKE